MSLCTTFLSLTEDRIADLLAWVSFCFLIGFKVPKGCIVCLLSFYFWSLHRTPLSPIPQKLLCKNTPTPFCHHFIFPPTIPCKVKSWSSLSLVHPEASLSAPLVQVPGAWFAKHTMLWLPGSGVLWAVGKGLHGGTGPCLVGLSCQVHIRHCLRNNWKPLFPYFSVPVYIVTTMEGHCKSTECLIYVSPKKEWLS